MHTSKYILRMNLKEDSQIVSDNVGVEKDMGFEGFFYVFFYLSLFSKALGHHNVIGKRPASIDRKWLNIIFKYSHFIIKKTFRRG